MASKTVQFRLDDDLWAQLEARAQAAGHSTNTLARNMIVQTLMGIPASKRGQPGLYTGPRPVADQDCRHPVNRRVGGTCMVCGKSVVAKR